GKRATCFSNTSVSLALKTASLKRDSRQSRHAHKKGLSVLAKNTPLHSFKAESIYPASKACSVSKKSASTWANKRYGLEPSIPPSTSRNCDISAFNVPILTLRSPYK